MIGFLTDEEAVLLALEVVRLNARVPSAEVAIKRALKQLEVVCVERAGLREVGDDD